MTEPAEENIKVKGETKENKEIKEEGKEKKEIKLAKKEKLEFKEEDNFCEEQKFVRLKGKIKKFDENLYNKYDQPAREILKEKLGDCIKDNPDIYAEDMLLDLKGCKYKFIEIQVCAEWFTEIFPHKTPFVFERKGHFSDKTLFVMFDKTMTKGLLFDRLSLVKKPRRVRKYSRIFVYDVPWNRVVKFETDFLDRDLLKCY
jgi:hypothetical protein